MRACEWKHTKEEQQHFVKKLATKATKDFTKQNEENN